MDHSERHPVANIVMAGALAAGLTGAHQENPYNSNKIENVVYSDIQQPNPNIVYTNVPRQETTTTSVTPETIAPIVAPTETTNSPVATTEVPTTETQVEIPAPTNAEVPATTIESTVPELTKVAALTEGVYCGPAIEHVMGNPQEVIDILKKVNISEVHPPCTSPYGRNGIGEGKTEVAPGVTLTRSNQIMLEFGKQNNFQFFVDSPRFISGDPEQIQAAYDDYKEWIDADGTSFGIELPDEIQPEAMEIIKPKLEALRDFFNAKGLDITNYVRPNFAILDNTPSMVRAFVDLFGPNLKAGVDAYTTDPETWTKIKAMMNQPGYEVKDWLVAIRGSSWENTNVGAGNEPPTAEEMSKYYEISVDLTKFGSNGVYLFTGFAASPNINSEVFHGNLTEKETMENTQKARVLAGANSENKILLLK